MKKILLYFSLSLLIFSVNAQTFKIETPQEVLVDEMFRVSYIFSTESSDGSFSQNRDEAKNFKADFSKIKNAEVLFGPSQSVSTVSRVNLEGQYTTSYTQTYTYTLKAGATTGEITIPTATVEIGNKKQSAKSVKVKIVASRAATPNKPSESTENPNTTKGLTKISDKDIFIKAFASKQTVGVGDTLSITYRLYTKKDIGYVTNTDYPSFRGFDVANIPLAMDNDFTEEEFEGEKYKVLDIRKYQLRSREVGNYTIQPLSLTFLFDTEEDENKIKGMSRRERYNSMIQKAVSSEPLNITVGISM